MKKHRNPGKGQNKVFSGKPEIRDNLDSRKNEEFRNTGAIKKAEVQQKEKQKETRKNKWKTPASNPDECKVRGVVYCNRL